MDLTQLENILTISEANSISEASKKLYITQSALNQQLINLEKELGIQLFHRSRNHLQITEAGRIYIEGAKEILHIRKNIYNRISDLTKEKHGTLRIGFTPDRGMPMFTSVYPQFYQKYPEMKIIPIENIAAELESLISRDELDFAFLTLSKQQQQINEYLPLASEELILTIPAAHPLAKHGASYSDTFPPQLPVIDLAEFRNDRFILIVKASTMRSLIDSCFADAGFEPDVLMETRSSSTMFHMVSSLKCCSILPLAYAKPSNDVVYFSLTSHPSWDYVVSYPKKIHLNQVSLDFIEMVEDYWKRSPFLHTHSR